MLPHNDDALEQATLRLVNAIALLSSTRSHTRRLRSATGIALPPADLRLLELLSGRQAVATSSLARELGVDLPQVSRQTKALEALGHLERSKDPADRRRTLVQLSQGTAELLDRWLISWTGEYLAGVASWKPAEIELLGNWFALAHERMATSLPDSPRPAAADRWLELAGHHYEPATRFFLHSVIGIVTWVALSGGYSRLLTSYDLPASESEFLTLHVIGTHGPLAIAELAERQAIDPSVASKRVRELARQGLLERAVDELDRRSTRTKLSRKGKDLVDRVFKAQMRAFETLTTDLAPEDRRQWTPYVEAYVAQVMDRPPRPDPLTPVPLHTITPR